MASRKWLSPKPVSCESCSTKFDETLQTVFYDARVSKPEWPRATWAIVCEPCFGKYGFGLGIGKGQKYDWSTLKKIGG